MFFFNLSLPEFLAVFGVLSSAVVALYLLDRVKKKHAVSSLRFFAAVDKAPQYQHRRRLRQPWSLLLQLISLLLLLLAIAQLRLGSPDRVGNDHVLVLDTSAWMAAESGRGRLIDQARLSARNYLKSLPANDRVMLVRADALPTPATRFIADHSALERAIDESQPGAAVLNLDQALHFAQDSQKLHAQRAGDIVFVGAGRILADTALASLPPNLRMIPVRGPLENVGIRKLTLRRSTTNPEAWDIFVAVKNYGSVPRSVPLAVGFGGAPIGTKRFTLLAGAEETVTFQYPTRAAGWIEARLEAREPFRLDDRALLELPSRELLPVTVYSDDPAALRPVFAAIPNIKVAYLPTAQYQPKSPARMVVLDRFAPPQPPVADSLWIFPPAAQSPVTVTGARAKQKLSRWKAEHPLAAGLHAKDLEIDNAETFRPNSDDAAVAETNTGAALVVARAASAQNPAKTVVFGFHPMLSPMKYELTTPLLFANIVRWIAPDVFTSYELNAGTVGAVNVALENESDPSAIQVLTEKYEPIPFTLDGTNLRFFSGAPGIVRISAGGRQLVYSLTLPQAGDFVWKPGNVKIGIPKRTDFRPGSRDIWHWLAILGGLGLIADWFLFGRTRRRYAAAAPAGNSSAMWRKAS